MPNDGNPSSMEEPFSKNGEKMGDLARVRLGFGPIHLMSCLWKCELTERVSSQSHCDQLSFHRYEDSWDPHLLYPWLYPDDD